MQSGLDKLMEKGLPKAPQLKQPTDEKKKELVAVDSEESINTATPTVEEAPVVEETPEQKDSQDGEIIIDDGATEDILKTPATNLVIEFVDMVTEFKAFCSDHSGFASFGVKFQERKPGEYVIMQGGNQWASLRPESLRGCVFNRTSLLRAIKNLPVEHPLSIYFKDYSLMKGIKV